MSLSTADTTTSTTLSPRSSNVERLSRKQRVGSSSLPVGSRHILDAGWRSTTSRLAHNQKIAGYNPAPATTHNNHAKAKGTVDRQFMPAVPFAINPERQDQRSL